MRQLFFTLLLVISCSATILAQTEDKDERSFFAENLSLMVDGRLDFNYEDFDNEYGNMTQDYGFQFTDLNIHTTGMLDENFGFEFMLRFNSNAVNGNQLLDNVKRANIRYTSDNKKWFFNAGRFFMNVGTAEQFYWGNDVYSYSLVNNNIGVYKTGITGQYTTDNNQTLGLQIVNSDVDKNMEYNVYWYGEMFDKLFEPKVSYAFIDNNDSIGVSHYLAVGGIWNLSKTWQLDTDFAYARNSTAIFAEGTAFSVPIRLAYNGEKFRPYIKYIYNKVDFDNPYSVTEADGSISVIDGGNVNTYEVALQYYPLKDKDLRFHVAGSYTSNQNLVDALTDPTSDARQHSNSQYQILAGVRLRFDFRKGW